MRELERELVYLEDLNDGNEMVCKEIIKIVESNGNNGSKVRDIKKCVQSFVFECINS